MPPRQSSEPPVAVLLRKSPALAGWTAGFVLTYGLGVALLGGLGAPEPWIPVGAGMLAAATFQAVGRRRAMRALPSAAQLKVDAQLGRALDGAGDANQVASVVIGTLRKVLKPRHAYIWLLDRERNDYQLAAGVGLPPEVESMPEARVQAWLAANSGAPDLTAEEAVAAAEFDRWLARHEIAWVEPIMGRGRALGLCMLPGRAERRGWTAGERWLVQRTMRDVGQTLALIDLAKADRKGRSKIDNLTQRYKDAQQRAITDGLTGLTTHVFFKEQLTQRFHEARRHTAPLSVLLIDIDHFKRINDTYGHPVGDQVLQLVAKAVKDAARACDTVARYGGEELALVLPRTDLVGAAALGERIREAIAELEPVDGRGRQLPEITASLGVAELEVDDQGPEDLIRRADAALYQAKRDGRNQVRQAG